LTVFNYWFDGLSAMAAIIAALVPRAMRESLPAAGGTVGRRNQVFGGVFVWAFLSAIVGLPYWIALIPLHDVLLGQTLHRQLAESPSLWLTFALMAAMHFWKAFHAGYGSMPEQELKQRARADVYLLFVRGIAMFIMAAQGFAFVLVPLMALLLSYFEIWPERVMRGAFDDPGENRSRDPADD